MKKIILLLSFCCFGFIVHAQDFLTQPMRCYLDAVIEMVGWERKLIENHDLYCSYMAHDIGKLFSQHDEFRRKWLKQIKNKVLTRELKNSLKDTTVLADRKFLINVYFDKEGKVYSVIFDIEKHIYDLLTKKWFKETYNSLMKEKINVTKIWDTFFVRSGSLAEIQISVSDFFLGKIRDQKRLKEESD